MAQPPFVKGGIVIKRYRVLIADKNPRIRNFLKREFTTAGYFVRLAESGEQLLKIVYGPTQLDLLIIDPDLPDADFEVLSRKLRNRVPPLPVVLHTLDVDLKTTHSPLQLVHWVEKNGSSVEHLKRTVASLLAAARHASGK